MEQNLENWKKNKIGKKIWKIGTKNPETCKKQISATIEVGLWSGKPVKGLPVKKTGEEVGSATGKTWKAATTRGGAALSKPWKLAFWSKRRKSVQIL